MQVSDKIKIDIDNNIFEGRIRLDLWDIQYTLSDTTITSPDLLLRGYGKINFGENFSLIAGNSYFSKFGIKSAEPYALDTTPNNGCILKSGLALYGEIPFNEKRLILLKLGSGLENDTNIASSKELRIGVGGDFIYKKYFSAGFSARNITAKEFGKYSISAGAKFGNLKLNLGFIYNNTDEFILTSESKYSADFSMKYKNDDLNFAIAADIISGLNSEYISNYENLAYDNNMSMPVINSLKKIEGAYYFLDLGLAEDRRLYVFLRRTKKGSRTLYQIREKSFCSYK